MINFISHLQFRVSEVTVPQYLRNKKGKHECTHLLPDIPVVGLIVLVLFNNSLLVWVEGHVRTGIQRAKKAFTQYGTELVSVGGHCRIEASPESFQITVDICFPHFLRIEPGSRPSAAVNVHVVEVVLRSHLEGSYLLFEHIEIAIITKQWDRNEM